MNSGLIAKVPDAGKDCEWKEKRASEDEMAGWHHQCNGHELGQTSGDGEGQGGLACCDPWGLKQLDTTGQLNNNNRKNQDYIRSEKPKKKKKSRKFTFNSHHVLLWAAKS